jgi:hypothetical protein
MNQALYHFLVEILDLFVWKGDLLGTENLPRHGPAVFVANHLDALGRIACFCSLPMRLHAWAIGDMMDHAKAAAYLNQDFTERQLHLKPPFSIWFSRCLSRITVPLLWSLGCIPVYKGDYERLQETLALSMKVLLEKGFLLIFPEEPNLEKEAKTGIAPFQHTFARLGEMYYAETSQRLSFYPLAIHPKRLLWVGKPVTFDPLNKAGAERQRLKSALEADVRRMYLQLSENGGEVQILKPAHK